MFVCMQTNKLLTFGRTRLFVIVATVPGLQTPLIAITGLTDVTAVELPPGDDARRISAVAAQRGLGARTAFGRGRGQADHRRQEQESDASRH